MSRLYTKTRTALKYFCLFAQKQCIIFVIKVNRFRRIYCRNHKTADETKTILHSYNNRAAVFYRQIFGGKNLYILVIL